MAEPSKISALSDARRKATLNALRGYSYFAAHVSLTTVDLTSGSLVVGHKYFIALYRDGDDFLNVGVGQNSTNSDFVATGTTPTNWSNGSVVMDMTLSPLVINVIDSTISFLPTFNYLMQGRFISFLPNINYEKVFFETPQYIDLQENMWSFNLFNQGQQGSDTLILLQLDDLSKLPEGGAETNYIPQHITIAFRIYN